MIDQVMRDKIQAVMKVAFPEFKIKFKVLENLAEQREDSYMVVYVGDLKGAFEIKEPFDDSRIPELVAAVKREWEVREQHG